MTFVPARDVASCLRASSMNVDDNTAKDGHLVVNQPTVDVVGAFTQGAHPGGFNGQDAYTGHAIPVAIASYQQAEIPDVTGSVLTSWQNIGANQAVDAGKYIPVAFDEFNHSLSTTHHAIRSGTRQSTGTVTSQGGSLAVRRLTPRECERLMGWPDDWTRWTADGTEVADSHRYRMCGNGVASPVAEWVGRCILKAAS